MSGRVLAEIVSDVIQGSNIPVEPPKTRYSDRYPVDSTVAARTGLTAIDVTRGVGLEVVWGGMTQVEIDGVVERDLAEYDLESEAQTEREVNETWFGHGENGVLSGPVGTIEEVVVERALDGLDNGDPDGFDIDRELEGVSAVEPPAPSPFKVYAVSLATDVDADERGLDPVTVCGQQSLRRVGTKAMLADLNSAGGFHIGELSLRDERGSRRGLDPEMEGNWDNVGLDGIEPGLEVDEVEDLILDGVAIAPQALIEESELELAAMERTLTQADQA